MASTTSSNRLLSRAAFALLAASVLWSSAALAQSPPSAADLATARELFLQARDLRTSGDLKGALEKFRGAWATAPTPIIGLELGRTYMQRGELIEAREAFLAVGRLKVESDETAKSAQARTEAGELAEQLRPKIATLNVKVTGATDGATLTVDGANVPLISGSATRKVNPGKHELVVKSGGAEKRDAVDVAEGESKDVAEDMNGATPTTTVPTPQPTPQPTPGPTESTSPDWVRPAMIYGGFGLAGVGVVVGGATGIVALGKSRTVKNECPGQVCPESARKDVTSGRTFATISTVGWIAGAVGAGAGLVGLFVLKPTAKSDAPKSDTPKAAHAIVPAATWMPGGAWLGAEGRF